MRRLFLYIFIFIPLFVSNASIPTGYYANADGKNTTALRSALKTIISANYNQLTYTELWNAYKTTDVNASGKIRDIYSACTFTPLTDQCGTYVNECDCYNREHTTPQSWFGDGAYPMYSDLFNVYPTDGKVNGERGNLPYGEVATPSYTSGIGCMVGPSSFSGYTGQVFEPVDEYKGDIARTVMYMAIRYADNIPSWISANSGSTEVENFYDATNGLTTYAINLLLSWSRMDPVSSVETLRNDAVYSIQNNRNPFIDYPGIEEYIWGNKQAGIFSISGSNPVNSASLSSGTIINNGAQISFGKVNASTVRTFRIKSVNITGDLTVQVSGTMFSVATSTISQSVAASGYELAVTFNPTLSGIFTGAVTISGGGLPSSFIINLTGER